MSTRFQPTPTSHLRFGLARADITPPVGIYHPMWGAARHHRATGIHRPLTAEVIALAPLAAEEATVLRIQLDHIGMTASHHQALLAHVTAATGITAENIVTTFSHSHAAGLFAPDRVHLPGGELIEDHVARIYTNITAAAVTAITNLQPAFITYATGKCTLATNRDYWDDESDFHACGFNPDDTADDTLIVARITGEEGALLGIVVNYGCHPTTLAWENTEISPDYVGAMREVVEDVTGATCIFALGACGELSPRQCHVGSTAVADANGRNLGYAALATLATMDPPAQDFHYAGPVISGATLGTWQHSPLSDARMQQSAIFAGGEYTVQLPQRKLPDPVALEAEMEEWGTKQQEADQAGDTIAARDYGARLERARRWRMRVQHLEDRPTAPFHYTVYRLGDAFWVTTGGEPYSLIQTELRKRFPDNPILFSPLANDFQMAYLLPADRYGRGLYQEEPSILAQGCLEELIEAVAGKIEDLL